MPAVFLYSDPHFSHSGMCKFTKKDGTKVRPWTDTAEMDDELVRRFNERVSVNDKVYFLGDVVINRKGLKVLGRLNCKNLVLIKGNHDIFQLDDYTPYFRDIRGYHVMKGVILSHIPIHPDSLGRFGAQIHGHLHTDRVMMDGVAGDKVIDPRYLSVCVEQIDYTPILLEDAFKRIIDQGGSIDFQKHGN
jgi:calcineurin-like phosphoesterase family protein